MVRSVQRELNTFFKEVSAGDYDIHQLTSSALTQSRAKLRPEAFAEMNDSVVRDFYEQAPYDTWQGHRLLSVDGSTINLPSHESVAERFGQIQVGRHADVPRSMARISMCYDVLNLLTLDAAMEGFHTSEKALLDQHLERVGFLPGDVLLADRGYASKGLMFRLLNKGVHFCFRMKDNWWKEIHEMQQKGETDKQVCFYLPQKDRDSMRQMADKDTGIQCRLVIVELENGQKEVLCTSLLSAEQYPKENFKELYHRRWGIEEAYKLLKSRADLEVFSGKTAVAVRQDFFAKIFMMTLCAAMSFPIEQKVREENQQHKNKHPRQINRTNALGFFRSSWIGLWLRKKVQPLLKAFDKILSLTTDIVRPNRSFPRKQKPKHPPAMAYKAL